MAKNKLNEGETLALIHYYGSLIAQANGGIGGCSRSDIIEWAGRVHALAKQMRSKNSECLQNDTA